MMYIRLISNMKVWSGYYGLFEQQYRTNMCGPSVRRAVQYVSYILIFYANSPLMISHILYSYQPTRWYGTLPSMRLATQQKYVMS